MDVSPLPVPANQLHRFYRGGARIAAFRGIASNDDYAPEDWVGSTTTAFGESKLGLSSIDGTLLRDMIADAPEAFLGPEEAARAAEPALLVKLLDAGQRLPVHIHPGDAFARRELRLPCGKTEAWVFLATAPGAAVRVGWARDIESEELADWVDRQDVEAMLDAMRLINVHVGDSLFVPAGLPHAIGDGILLLEVQQPSDLSILLEWEGFPVQAEDAFLGVERELALAAVDRTALSDERIAKLSSRRGSRLFPEEADAFFRAETLAPTTEVEAGFAILVVTEGEGTVETSAGDALPVRRGSTALVPHAAGSFSLTSTAKAYCCRPPDPRS